MEFREGSGLEKKWIVRGKEAGGGYRAVTERFCPVVGHNVPVAVTRRGFTESDAECLSGGECGSSLQGCRNRYLA